MDTQLENGNKLQRIGEVFDKEIEDIKTQRLLLGLDKKKKSTRALTDLLVTHTQWSTIKDEMVRFDFHKKEIIRYNAQ